MLKCLFPFYIFATVCVLVYLSQCEMLQTQVCECMFTKKCPMYVYSKISSSTQHLPTKVKLLLNSNLQPSTFFSAKYNMAYECSSCRFQVFLCVRVSARLPFRSQSAFTSITKCDSCSQLSQLLLFIGNFEIVHFERPSSDFSVLVVHGIRQKAKHTFRRQSFS